MRRTNVLGTAAIRGASDLAIRGARDLAVGLALVLVAAPAAAASGGLEIFPDPRVLIALIVLYVVLIYPVNKLLFHPLLGVLDERRERIDGARARSEEIAKEADDVLSRYEVAIRSAKEDAETTRRSQLEAARGDEVRAAASARSTAEGEITAARAEVTHALAEARQQLRGQAEQLAREAASRVLGRPLS